MYTHRGNIFNPSGFISHQHKNSCSFMRKLSVIITRNLPYIYNRKYISLLIWKQMNYFFIRINTRVIIFIIFHWWQISLRCRNFSLKIFSTNDIVFTFVEITQIYMYIHYINIYKKILWLIFSRTKKNKMIEKNKFCFKYYWERNTSKYTK